MTLSRDFALHLKKNSFVSPKGSYYPEDLAKAVNNLSSILEGPAEENIDKLKKFVITSDQKLAISSHRKTIDNRVVPWAVSQVFLDFLDSSLDYKKWARAGNRDIFNSYGWVTFNSAYYGLKKDHIPSFISRLRKAREEEKVSRYKTLYEMDNSGLEFKYVKMELEYISNQRRFWTSCISGVSREFSNVICLSEDTTGFTFSYGNLVVVKGHEGRNKSLKVKPYKTLMSMKTNVEKVMKLRSSVYPLSRIDRDLTYSFGCPFDGTELITISTYIHEVGHQIYFKEKYKPPKNSISLGRNLNRGITDYSTESDDEAFAEAFVAYVLNPEVLMQHDKPLYDWVNDTVNTVLSR